MCSFTGKEPVLAGGARPAAFVFCCGFLLESSLRQWRPSAHSVPHVFSKQLRIKDMAARAQPVVARDFMRVDLGDILSGEGVMKKHNLSPGADRHSMPRLLNNMAMAGIGNSAWSKAATMQHFLPLTRGSSDNRSKEQIAENLPESSFPHIVPPLQTQDLASYNQKNGLRIQGDSLINSSAQVREECGSSIPISGGVWGSSTRTMISPSKPEANAVNSPSAASELRLPSAGVKSVEHDPPLTIFYAGSVKVFNNISPEQAEAIMILASASDVQGNPFHPVTTTVAAKSLNSKATLCPHDKSLMNLHGVVNPQSNARQVHQFTPNMQRDFENHTIPVPASNPVPSGQPMVPTALPHARKASLARFLEKRRERAQSTHPYPVKGEDAFSPEERLSSSNDPTCYTHTPCSECVDKKQKLIPSWMERVSEC